MSYSNDLLSNIELCVLLSLFSKKILFLLGSLGRLRAWMECPCVCKD